MSEAGNRRPRDCAPCGAGGFTLLEMMVTVAVMALVAAIVAPNMVRSLDFLELHETTRLLQADLRVMRATAIRTGQKVDLEATNHGREYDWIGGSRILPPTITMTMPGPIVVYPDGSVQPATVDLSAHGRHFQVYVDAINGAVTVSGR
jgi:prepilin-type N-terminal cleavage/methylation domain-containing protein